MEFFDWVFLTADEQAERQENDVRQKQAIKSEMEKIQRSLNYIGVDGGVSVENEETKKNMGQFLGQVSTESVYTELTSSTVQSKAQTVITNNQAQIDEIAKLLASV